MDEKETKNGITAVLPAAGISAPEPPSAPAGSAASPSLSPAELADLRASYPDADPEQDMNDPVFRGLVCGEIKPTLRQVYELFHRDRLTAAAVGNAVSDALAREIPPAVETAVAAAEQRFSSLFGFFGFFFAMNKFGNFISKNFFSLVNCRILQAAKAAYFVHG